MRALWLVLVALSAGSSEPAVKHFRGRLTAHGKPVTGASFFIASMKGVTLDQRTGAFDLTATAPGLITIRAEGFAPTHVASAEDLGEVQLHPLKTAQLSVKVGANATVPQSVTLTDGACANLRAQDASRCRFNLCLEQAGPMLMIHLRESSGPFHQKGSTVTLESPPVLEANQTWLSEAACRAELHVDAISAQR